MPNVARLRHLWNRLRSTYWFVPSLIIGGCFGLSYAIPVLDAALGTKYVLKLSFVYTRDPQAARELLSVVSQSMITVAGVVFSITVVALTMASNQFGTRVLKSFAGDTGNQVVLGTFLGTFLYGILTMRRVEAQFVPSLSIAVGIFLAVAGVAVLVYFIHHVIYAIQAESVVAAVADDLYATLDVLFPEDLGEGGQPPEEALSPSQSSRLKKAATEVCSGREGFIRTFDSEKLLRLACDNDALIHILVMPGDYVLPQTVLARFSCADKHTRDLASQLAKSIKIGRRRTYGDDIAFGFQQLTLVAVRSLSPAINAVGTALDVIEQLGASLIRLGNRRIPSRYRRSEKGELRVVTPSWDLAALMDSILDPIRYAAAGNPAVVAAAVRMLANAASHMRNRELAGILRQHIDRFADTAHGFRQELDRRRLLALCEELRHPRAA